MPPPFRFTSFPFRVGLMQFGMNKADIRSRAYAIRPYNGRICRGLPVQLRHFSRTPFFLFVLLLFALFSLSACPEPPLQSDGSAENIEAGVEKTEATAESTPEESVSPEESATPEDGAPIDQEPIREEGPEPDIKETDKPYIERLNGNGRALPVNPAASPSKIDNLPAAPTKPSPSRIKDALVIEGNLLNQIDRWVLQSKDLKNTEQTWLNEQIQRDSNMKHTLSLLGRNLVAGAFLLLGFSANTQLVSADVFILQGEPGKDGAQGPKGDKGDPGLTLPEQSQLQALLPKLKANGNKLIITADEISFESTAGTEAGKMTIDSAKKELTFSTGTTIFSLTNTQITATTNQTNFTTPTFEIKSPGTTPTTSLKLDDAARSVSLRVTQKNSNPSIQATFSLEGGDANTSPAPLTKYPLAIFNSTNVQVQSGLGFTAPPGPMPTDPPRTNSLGNLIVGYNENPSGGSFAGYRAGSHNFVLGPGHVYSSVGGFVAGQNNIVSGAHSSVSGGQGNAASGAHSSISGGQGNKSGQDPLGQPSTAATHTFVCGGNGNFANTNHKITCP